MRCQEVQDHIIGGTLDASAREHLAACPNCASFAVENTKLAEAFAALAKVEAPEPSWGFADRVLRRLDESPAGFFEPLEVIGRRAVYAAGLVAMTVVMLLTLSSNATLSESAERFRGGDSVESAEILLAGGVDEVEEVNVLPENWNGGNSR